MDIPPLRNFDHDAVSVSIESPSNSKGDASFHCIAYSYSLANWDGFCVHLRYAHGIISIHFLLLLLLVNFISEFRLKLMYIFLTINIRSSLTHLDGFQLFVLLPYLIEVTLFVCANIINLLRPK